MMRTALLLLCLAAAIPAAAQEGHNPFTSSGPAPRASLLSSSSGLAGTVLSVLAPIQKQLNDSLAAVTQSLQGSASLGGLLLVVAFSLGYGVFHAAGPGHGKTVVSSYFVANEPRVGQVLLVGNLIAAVHAVSALAVVLVLSFLVRGIFSAGLDQANLWIQRASFATITVIGAVLLVQRIRGREHHHGGHRHDHGHDHGAVRDGRQDAPGSRGARLRNLLAIAIPAGMIPCPGAVAVIVFALSLHMVWVSVLSVAAMSLGMGMTISVAALLVVLAKRGLVRLAGDGVGGRGRGLRRGIEIAGAAILLLFGGILLVSQF
jgi:nickel/cobalt transporter (NicO) family protein